MKKILAIMGVLAVVACSGNISENNGAKRYIEFSAQEAKTELKGSDVLWVSGDAVSILDGRDNEIFTTAGEGVSAVFRGMAYDADVYYAVYPYNPHTALSGGVISTVVPAVQNVRAGSFAEGANVSVAKSSGRVLSMKNVCGYVKFHIEDGASFNALTISTLGGEKIVGPYDVTIDGDGIPSAVAAEAAGSSVELVPVGGGFASGDYYAVMAPVVFSKGLRFTFSGNDGFLYVKDIPYVDRVDRNLPLHLSRVDDELEKVSPGISLDPRTVTRIPGGETSSSIYIKTNCPEVSVKVKDGATLGNVSVAKVSLEEYTVSFTNPGVDPKDIREATVVFSATGAEDLEVTVSQCPRMVIDFAKNSFVPALPTAKSTTATSHKLKVGTSTYDFAIRCAYYKSALLFKGKESGVLGYFEFPGIEGLTLDKVFISIKAHSSNCSIRAAIKDAEGAIYSDTFSYAVKNTATTHTFVLGENGKESPEPGVVYRMISTDDKNCLIDKIFLSYR